MAVPKTTETRCRDGSVQARQVIKRLHKQPHPYIFLFSHCMALMFPELSSLNSQNNFKEKERCTNIFLLYKQNSRLTDSLISGQRTLRIERCNTILVSWLTGQWAGHNNTSLHGIHPTYRVQSI